MHAQYFEGILQLRNPNEEILRILDKHSDHISKIIRQKNGFDYYFTSNKVLRHLTRNLKKNFGGIIKESPRLFSRNRLTQKAIYRLNILYELFDFKKGDVLNIDNKIIKITNISKKISGLNIKINKKVSFFLKKKKIQNHPHYKN